MKSFARVVLSISCCLSLAAACSSKGALPEPPAGAAKSCAGHGAVGEYGSTLIAQLQASSVVFRGTVTAVGASTVTDPIDPAHTVIAHVDSTIFAGPDLVELDDTWGDQLTIEVRGPALAVGASATFVAQIEVWDGQLEVGEITRVDEARFPQFAHDAPRMMQLFASDPLYARVASAREIVAGGVASVKPVPPTGAESEHSPGWQAADVDPYDVLCGPDVTSAAPVLADFPGSEDIAWVNAPKLAAQQQGVLLLHGSVVPSSDNAPDPFVLVALDVHPLADDAQIQALIDSPPPLP